VTTSSQATVSPAFARSTWASPLGAVAAFILGLGLVGLFVGVIRPLSHNTSNLVLGALLIGSFGLAVAWLAMMSDGHVGIAPVVGSVAITIAVGYLLVIEAPLGVAGAIATAMVAFGAGHLFVAGPCRFFSGMALAMLSSGFLLSRTVRFDEESSMFVVLSTIACEAAVAFTIALSLPSWRTKPARR
jgi:hypothetical protein